MTSRRPLSAEATHANGSSGRPLMLNNGHVLQIQLADMRPGPWQPRRVFEEDGLWDLAKSMKSLGVLTPLKVTRGPNGDGFLIIAGERRWRAAKRAGIAALPCFLVDGHNDEGEFRELAIVD